MAATAYTKSQLAAMAEPRQALLDALRARPMPDMTGGDPSASLVTIRRNRAAHLATLRHLYPTSSRPAEVREREHFVDARDGHKIPIRITYPPPPPPPPPSSVSPSPLIVLFHEGGWCLGDLSDEEHDAWVFSRDLNAVCINVAYRLAPEHIFPLGLHDCQDVLRWAARTASPDDALLPADPLHAGYIVGGSSAGANLSAVLCQLSRDEDLRPAITGQYLSVAATLNDDAVPEAWKDEYHSRALALRDPVLDLSKPPHAFVCALQVDTADPRFSPCLHPNLAGLPPAYFQICGMDPLRDEGLLYAKLLGQRAVKTRVDVYEGYGHMFWTNWPEMQRSKDFFADTVKGMEWLLDLSAR